MLDKTKIRIASHLRKLNWGIAGLGKFAETTFIPSLLQLKKSKLISLYSASGERESALAEKFGVQEYYNNFDDFLKSNIDAVYISSANSDHYHQVIKAAKARKHIHCEKPLAINSGEAEEMVRTCKENNVFLSVNYVYRYHPLIIKAKEIIDNGMIGKIVSINTNFNVDFAPNDNFRFKFAKSGGGALRDLGTHMIDLMRFFGGEIIDIKGYLDNVVYRSEVDDFATGILKFKSSGYGYFNVSFNNKRSFNRIEILGYKGAISIQNLVSKRNSPSKLIIDIEGEAKKAFRKRANKQLFLLKSIQSSFLNNIEPEVTGEDGLINLKLMETLEKNETKE